jgi:phage terminase small subunit
MSLKLLSKVPDPPKMLDDVAAEHWRTTMKVLVDDQLVTELDEPIIAMACSVWAKWQKTNDQDEIAKMARLYVSIMSKYGATPVSRKSITTVKGKKKKNEEVAEVARQFGL